MNLSAVSRLVTDIIQIYWCWLHIMHIWIPSCELHIAPTHIIYTRCLKKKSGKIRLLFEGVLKRQNAFRFCLLGGILGSVEDSKIQDREIEICLLNGLTWNRISVAEKSWKFHSVTNDIIWQYLSFDILLIFVNSREHCQVHLMNRTIYPGGSCYQLIQLIGQEGFSGAFLS